MLGVAKFVPLCACVYVEQPLWGLAHANLSRVGDEQGDLGNWGALIASGNWVGSGLCFGQATFEGAANDTANGKDDGRTTAS